MYIYINIYIYIYIYIYKYICIYIYTDTPRESYSSDCWLLCWQCSVYVRDDVCVCMNTIHIKCIYVYECNLVYRHAKRNLCAIAAIAGGRVGSDLRMSVILGRPLFVYTTRFICMFVC